MKRFTASLSSCALLNLRITKFTTREREQRLRNCANHNDHQWTYEFDSFEGHDSHRRFHAVRNNSLEICPLKHLEKWFVCVLDRHQRRDHWPKALFCLRHTMASWKTWNPFSSSKVFPSWLCSMNIRVYPSTSLKRWISRGSNIAPSVICSRRKITVASRSD